MKPRGSLLLLGLLLYFPGDCFAAPPPEWQQDQGYRRLPISPQGSGQTGFTLLHSDQTSILFTNVLVGDAFLTNVVAHNGSGVAVGDVDGDGWADLYFSNLQGPNVLYRNLGNFKFEPMDAGAAACGGQMSTGAAFADVDGDGDLDLLVNAISAGTKLFLNGGKGDFQEKSDSGLSRTASSTSMALADIDGDGDLDLYCAHYIDVSYLSDPTTRIATSRKDGRISIAKVNDQPASMPKWKDRFEVLADGSIRELPEYHGLYRNMGGGRFESILFEPGQFADTKGKAITPYRDWGLAAMFRDVNGDLAPDLYVANDNASPDRFWINNGKGKFLEINPLCLRHTSRSSMGVDFADINRDGRDDFLVLDMMSRDHARRQVQLAKSEPNPALRENIEEQPRYNRNALFLGRSDGTYAEAALMAGVAATDWAWCPMFLDVDLDGYEDLLVTNGFDHDVLDQDVTEKFRRMRLSAHELKRYRKFYPSWHSPNAAFRNQGDGTYKDASSEWRFNLKGVSNGMAAGDLDNDGDLDVVINNLNGPASVYRNDSPAPRIAVRLKGADGNSRGVGSRLKLEGGPVVQSQEIIAGGRYMSSDEGMRVFAAAGSGPFKLEVSWRSGKRTIITKLLPNHIYEVEENALENVVPPKMPQQQPLFVNLNLLLGHQHKENAFEDWDVQPSITRRLSRLGPGVGWIDFNSDGWEDLIIASAKGGKLAVYASDHGDKFTFLEGSEVASSDQTAVVGWADGKGSSNFLVAQSNAEGTSTNSQIMLFSPKSAPEAIDLDVKGAAALAVGDIDGDGDLDLFVGGRGQVNQYPSPASSEVLINDNGILSPSPEFSKPFQNLGMVTSAVLCDLDGDGWLDLVLGTEWGPLMVFKNNKGRFADMTSAWGFADKKGLWGGVAVGDFNNDGLLDLAAGNWGRNSTYELHHPAPIRLYYSKSDADAAMQLVEAFQHEGKWLPMRDRNWYARIFPGLVERFPTHHRFAQSDIQEIFGETYKQTKFLEINYLESTLFLREENGYHAIALPKEAQLAPVSSINVADFDGDGFEDLFLAQNFFGVIPEQTRNDAGRGLVLKGKGDGQFVPMEGKASGIKIYGEQRAAAVADFNHDGRPDLAVAQNNAETTLWVNKRAKPGLRVMLKGGVKNPNGIGASMRLRFKDGSFGPRRVIVGGSGYLGFDSLVPVLSLSKEPAVLEVTWPHGVKQLVSVEASMREITVEAPSR